MVKRFVVGGEGLDQYGHVNYKAVSAMLETFQDALLSHKGLSFESIEQDFGLRSFVKKLEITWYSELREGDECLVNTNLELGNTSMTFYQTLIHGDGRQILTQNMVVVIADGDGKPTTIPAELRRKLTRHD